MSLPALGACLLLAGWSVSAWADTPAPAPATPTAAPEAITPTADPGVPPAAITGSCRPAVPGLPLDGARARWIVSPCMGGVQSIVLEDEQFEVDAAEAPAGLPAWAKAKYEAGQLDLVESWDAKWDPYRDLLEDVRIADLQLGVRTEGGQVDSVPMADLATYHKLDPLWGVVDQGEAHVTLAWPDPARVRSPLYLVKRYSLQPDRPYGLRLDLAVWNVGQAPAQFRVQHEVTAFQDPARDTGGFFAVFAGLPDSKGAAFKVGEELIRFDFNGLAEAEAEERTTAGTPDWLGVESRYFLKASAPAAGFGDQATATLQALSNGMVLARLRSASQALAGGGEACQPSWYTRSWGGLACTDDLKLLGLDASEDEELDAARLDEALQKARQGGASAEELARAVTRLRTRQVARMGYELYAGPKDLELLEAAGHGLGEAVDFGWFAVIARPMLFVLKMSHDLAGSWPLAILILTLLVKILLWPVTIKSIRSMRNMAKIKPELDKIRADLEAQARKQGQAKPDPQELNRATFELYKKYQVNPLGGCLPLLLQMPVYIALYRTIMSSVELFNQPLFLWVDDLTQKDPYFILPVFLGVFMFLQQKLTPQTAGDPAQQKMLLYFMPVLFTLMMLQLPSGLTFYILVNTILGIIQTVVLNRTDVATTPTGKTVSPRK